MTSFHPSVAYGILIFMMWNKLGPLIDKEWVTHWGGSIAPLLSSKSHEDSVHSDHQASTGCVYGCWLAENVGRTASLEVSGAIDKVEKQQEFQSCGGASWCLSLLGQQFEIGINSWEGTGHLIQVITAAVRRLHFWAPHTISRAVSPFRLKRILWYDHITQKWKAGGNKWALKKWKGRFSQAHLPMKIILRETALSTNSNIHRTEKIQLFSLKKKKKFIAFGSQ